MSYIPWKTSSTRDGGALCSLVRDWPIRCAQESSDKHTTTEGLFPLSSPPLSKYLRATAFPAITWRVLSFAIFLLPLGRRRYLCLSLLGKLRIVENINPRFLLLLRTPTRFGSCCAWLRRTLDRRTCECCISCIPTGVHPHTTASTAGRFVGRLQTLVPARCFKCVRLLWNRFAAFRFLVPEKNPSSAADFRGPATSKH